MSLQLDPERITTAQAAELFGLFAELNRLGAAGQVLLGPRVAQSDAWKNEGHRSAASWVAKADRHRPRRGHRHARDRRTAPVAPEDDRGAAQRHAVGATGARDRGRRRGRPAAEVELLEAATTGTLKGLKDQCRRVRAAAGSARGRECPVRSHPQEPVLSALE